MNTLSSTVFYDQRISISEPIANPITWKVSKVENMKTKGISELTFSQDRWNEHTDVFEYLDGTITSTFYDNRDVVAIWSDYSESEIKPKEIEIETIKNIHSVVTFSGVQQSIKSGGSYKKFTVNFYDNDALIDLENGQWNFYIKNKYDIDAKDLITILTKDDSSDVSDNQIKIKFNKNDSFIGDILIVEYKSNSGITSNVEIDIVGL